jgi:hypothetical protein
MNMRVLISVLVLVAVSLAVVLWVGGASAPELSSSAKRFAAEATIQLDREAPFPVATTEETEHTFLEMELGSTGEHTFIIRNTGEDILWLEKGSSTCKCTLSNLEKPEIAPGESAEIKLEWIPKDASDQFSQSATIFTNDPKNQLIEFSIMGRVLNAVDIYPEDEVNAGEVLENTGADGRLAYLSKLRDELDPPTVNYEGDNLTFEIVPMSAKDLAEQAAKTGHLVKIHVKPTIPVGEFRDQFTLEYTLNGEKKSLLQSVTARRTGPIEIINARGTTFIQKANLLNLGRFPAKDGKKAKLTLLIDKLESGEQLKITKFESEKHPELKLTSVENTELDIPTRAAFDLFIEMPPGAAAVDQPRSRSSTIVVGTNHPEVKEVTIFVELHSY